MAIDLKGLNTNFGLLSRNDSFDDLFSKIVQPRNDYLVVLKRDSGVGAAKVLDRRDLLSRLAAALYEFDADDEIRQMLENSRDVSGQSAGWQERYWEDVSAKIGASMLRAPMIKSEIDRIVQGVIEASPTRKTIKFGSIAPLSMRGTAVVMKNGSPLGIVESKRSNRATRAKPIPLTYPTSLAESTSPAAAPPFHAHPKLAVDRPLLPDMEFQFLVGFSESADAEADFTTPIDIPDPQVGETMDVLISVSGAELVGAWKAELPLDLSARYDASAKVHPDATEVKLSASYVFRKRLVGTISKTIPVGSTKVDQATLDALAIPSWLPALGDAESIAAVDIILIVAKRGTDTIEWKAYLPNTGAAWGPIPIPLSDTTMFAKQLADILERSGDQGEAARLEVVGVGQAITELIPAEIIDEVLKPQFASNRAPTILLFTDEPFVPWELARLSPAQASRLRASFLGEVACIGRWWLRANSSGPSSSALIQHVSAVAASKYDDASNDTLQHAIAEQKLLVKKYSAEKVEARAKPMDQWLTRTPRQAGHLAHIALHGYNDPVSRDEGLILGDGTSLTPIRLSGEWNQGDVPRFSMVFLNACQVGTAGSRLGQVAGFPGVLIRNGTGAFLAPLWKVDDQVASKVADTFYQQVLLQQTSKQGAHIGETLRSIRANPPVADSITPLAYVYYGHPALCLERSAANR